MNKMIESLVAWLGAKRRQSAERREATAECRMFMDARRTIQVCEFGGEVYVSMDGVPLLPVDGLKWDLPTALDVAREAYVKYQRYGYDRG